MLTRPTRDINNESLSYRTFEPAAHKAQTQDGLHPSLVDIPAESLTHITSYLSPPSLFALSRTSRRLHDHVEDDNTWYHAFMTQFMRVCPDSYPDNERFLLLRRMCRTWRKEFTTRYTFRKHWENSSNVPVMYSPQDADAIDDVHLMSENGLLTLNMQYGTVARSLPLNNKILRGHLAASGTGLSNGNHDTQLTHNISACTLTSDSGTARVFWGKRNGEIAVTTVDNVMDPRRAWSKLSRCRVEDQHEGVVQKLVVDEPTQTFLSAGSDGHVKLWDWKTLHCLWVSDKQVKSLVVDAFLLVAGGFSQGGVVGALRSGDICVWVIPPTLDLGDLPTPIQLPEVRVSCPIQAELQTYHTDNFVPRPKIRRLWMFRTLDSSILILADYSDHPYFYRIHFDPSTGKVEITQFGHSSYGYTSTVEAVHSLGSGKDDFVIVGDHLGFVRIYSTGFRTFGRMSVTPAYTVEAHTDGAVTAIAWNPDVLVIGSAQGTTAVWDALTLEPLRFFSSPVPRWAVGGGWGGVTRIFVKGELLVVVIGNRVMAWTAGILRQRGQEKNKHKRTKNLATKGQHRHELQRDISESFEEYKMDNVRHGTGCGREHWLALNSLGLSELEAVQYALMLSREGEDSWRQSQAVRDEMHEGEFEDILGTPMSLKLQPSTASRPTSSSTLPILHHTDKPRSPLADSITDEKLSLPEAMDAIADVNSPTMPTPSSAFLANKPVLSSSWEDFPTLGSSSSSASSGQPCSVSPSASRSAWGIPKKVVSSSSTGSTRSAVDEWDDDLRFAIALSIAEAHSLEEANR